MRFDIQNVHGDHDSFEVEVRRVLIAGYTGRDRAAVEAHIDELADHGVAPPKRIPSLFPCVTRRVTSQDRIQVHGAETSGEAEFLTTRHNGELLVSVGSDHTDRGLEAHSVIKSKQVCDKVVSSTWWRAHDVRDHWDKLQLKSTTWVDDTEIPYQDDVLAHMLPLDDLVAQVEDRVGDIDDDILYSGTFALLTDGFQYGTRFRAELIDPVLNRSLVCDYQVQVLPPLDD